MTDWRRATHWLVKYPGHPAVVMTDEEFVEFIDRVKYDGVQYEAQPLRRAGDQLPSRLIRYDIIAAVTGDGNGICRQTANWQREAHQGNGDA